jgi:hypothetical protein
MLGLTLREEFRGKRLKGTAIELSNDEHTGATDVSAEDFLGITYPTLDLLKAIEAIGPDKARPVVLIGERGLGKSHLLAAMYHSATDLDATRSWLDSWAKRLNEPKIGEIQLRGQMQVISESLHRQHYKFLWDLLFERHPKGDHFRGKWDGMGTNKTDVPSDTLIREMLEQKPTILLLDEFQTWFDGLRNDENLPAKNWAFNFIQILSEIAKEHPDLLALVISVRNGESDAYQQIHRVNPISIDFKAGGSPERIQLDRRRMLLHRLFDNRAQIDESEIEHTISTHVAEFFRLMNTSSAEQERRRKEFNESWPFAPNLLRLLEEQVLVATNAQETRDLIRILASLYKSRGEQSILLTAADFRVDDDDSGIGALLDSVATERYRTIREKAQHNITSVEDAVPDHKNRTPHLRDIISALWLRSIAMENFAGGDPATLQTDITRNKPVDDNAFQSELSVICENSFNIHQAGPKLIFREDENPQAKLLAHARNDKFFENGSDMQRLAKEIRYVIVGSDDSVKNFRVVVLPKSWRSEPWSNLEESDRPENWDDRFPVLALPEEPQNLNADLGKWLKDNLNKRRNTIRFLLPRKGTTNVFMDKELLILARAEMKAEEWRAQMSAYKELFTKYQKELRDKLKKRFDRFAILLRWNFGDTTQSAFCVEHLSKEGSQLVEEMEKMITDSLFVNEDFEEIVFEAAKRGGGVGKLLSELREPRPSDYESIPWLGETAIKEKILRICARGKISINVRGQRFLQQNPGENSEETWMRIRGELSFGGHHLDEVILMEPSAAGSTGGAAPIDTSPNGDSTNSLIDNGSSITNLPPSANPTDSFGGSTIYTPTQLTCARIPLNNPSTSPLNLIGKIEEWNIGPATKVHEISIKVTEANGAQLKELLKKLPDGLAFALSLEKEES